MNNITIHDKNGTDAITAPVEQVLQELASYGVLNPFRSLIAALDGLAKTKGQNGVAREIAEEAYKFAISECRKIITTCYGQVAEHPQPKPVAQDSRACKSCGALIVWFTTEKGAHIPVDASSVTGPGRVFIAGQHKPHFSTCPHASKHRNTPPKKQPFTRPNGVTAEDQAKLFDQ